MRDLQGLCESRQWCKKLPHLYKQLWQPFKNVKNTQDIEQLRQVLIPKTSNQGQSVDANQKVRGDFLSLAAFGNVSCFAVGCVFSDKASAKQRDSITKMPWNSLQIYDAWSCKI